jgi:hypothetical protein
MGNAPLAGWALLTRLYMVRSRRFLPWGNVAPKIVGRFYIGAFFNLRNSQRRLRVECVFGFPFPPSKVSIGVRPSNNGLILRHLPMMLTAQINDVAYNAPIGELDPVESAPEERPPPNMMEFKWVRQCAERVGAHRLRPVVGAGCSVNVAVFER